MSARIVYIMGVAGSGKTTIGSQLATLTNVPFFDGDDFHSVANKEKMRAGRPLDDDDRKEWLTSLNTLAKKESGKKGAIIACSALKEKYRRLLADGIEDVHFIFLQGGFELIQERMRGRKDHYMPETLLQSQFDALETPDGALHIDVTLPVDSIIEIIQKEFFAGQGKF